MSPGLPLLDQTPNNTIPKDGDLSIVQNPWHGGLQLDRSLLRLLFSGWACFSPPKPIMTDAKHL
jgi:hypothetical protein